jgi:uncharacterized membrane protein HdeD (DUF308 family)
MPLTCLHKKSGSLELHEAKFHLHHPNNHNITQLKNSNLTQTAIMYQAIWLDHASSAYLMGTASIILGLFAIFSPTTGANLFGISLPPSPPQTSPASAFLAAKGARDITIGILYLVFGYEAEFRMVRILMLAHIVTGAVDAVVAWNNGGEKGEKRQWTFGIGTVGLVVALAVGL